MKIAVTGGIAEGKSTVLRMIAEAGHPTFDSDRIAAEIRLLPEVQQELQTAFGTSEPSELRSRLQDQSARDRLNSILHPRILTQLQEGPAGFYEVPLLFETCIWRLFDQVWVVTCGPEEQLKRLRDRYGSDVAAIRIRDTQVPTVVKVHLADRVFRTNSDVGNVRDHVLAAIRTLE